MPIRPLDIMKTQEVSQIKHIENQRTQHIHDQQSKSFQNMVTQEQYKPTQAAKSDNNQYRYDAKEKGNNQYSGSRGKKQKKEQDAKPESKTAKPQKGGSIDIMI